MASYITMRAPAKINLFLDVLEKREDGYHDLSSVMQTVGIFDTVKITLDEGEGNVSVSCDGGIPSGEDNTAYAAAEKFLAAADKHDVDVKIEIEKTIPSCAGLGGGSSDAAAVLIALNGMFGEPFDTAALIKIGAEVGADVPFCVKRGTCLAGGTGDVISSCTPMPDCAIVVAVPTDEKISTAQAYGRIDKTNGSGDISKMLKALSECSLDGIGKAAFNKFELIMPESSKVPAIKQALSSFGARAVLMSGSGSAVFGLFDDVPRAKSAVESLSESYETFICRPFRRDDDLVLDEGEVT